MKKKQRKSEKAAISIERKEYPRLYHYTSMESALKIVESQTLLMSGREYLNDPFDYRVPFAHKNQIDPIITNIETCIRQFVGGLPCRYSGKAFFRALIDHFPEQLGANPPRFDRAFSLAVRQWVTDKLDELSTHQKKIHDEYGKRAVVSSFGTRPDNLSLWGQYARSHSGAAIEFDFPEENWNQHLFHVRYTESEPTWFSIQEWCDLLFQYENTMQILERSRFLEKSFTYKSKDWEKEEEVRFVGFQGLDVNPKREPILLHQGEMTRVLIGVKADPVLTDILKKICKARDIKVTRMEITPESFAIRSVEDE